MAPLQVLLAREISSKRPYLVDHLQSLLHGRSDVVITVEEAEKIDVSSNNVQGREPPLDPDTVKVAGPAGGGPYEDLVLVTETVLAEDLRRHNLRALILANERLSQPTRDMLRCECPRLAVYLVPQPLVYLAEEALRLLLTARRGEGMQQCETDTLSDAGVLVVGYGGLGKLVSSRLQSLGMRIVCALSSQTDELPPRPEVEDEAHDASENAAVGNEEALPSKDTGIPVSLARVSLGKEEREELEKQAKIEIYEKRGLVSARDRTQLSALRDKDDEATEMDTGPELGRDGEHASDKSDTEKVSRESGLWNWCSGKHGEGEDVKAEQQVNEKVVVRKVGPADVVLTDCQGPTLVEGVQANRICDTDSTVATSKDSGEGHTSSGVLMRSLSKAAASTALNATTSAAVAAVSAGGALTASAAGSVTRSVITTTGTVASWGLERVGGAYAGYTVRAAASATGYAASSAVTSAGIMAGTAAGVITRAAISVSGSAVTVASNAWLRALERRRLRLELQAGTAEPLSGKQILPEEYDPLLVSDDEKDVNADDNIKMYSVDALNMFAAAEDIEFIIVCGDEEERLRGALGESELHLMSCRCNEKMAIICVGDAQAVDIELLEALAQLRRTRQTTSHETLKRIPSVLCRSSLDILDHATPSLQPKGEQDTAVAGSSRTLQELCSEMRSTVHIEGIAAPFSTPLSCENESTTWGPRVERQRARKLARMLVKGARGFWPAPLHV